MASQLISQGHEVFAAVKDVHHAYDQMDDIGVRWIQAPYSQMTFTSNNIQNHADILYCRGYYDHKNLAGLTRAWIDLMLLVKPDRIVCESAPTASLAARSIQIPVVAIDTGFFMPPVDRPMPAFRGKNSMSTKELLDKELFVLKMINASQALLGLPTLSRFQDIFDMKCLWVTWPELSHFGKHNENWHTGPVFRGVGASEKHTWKTKYKKAFVYLKGENQSSLEMLQSVLDSGCEVIGYLPGAPKSALMSLRNTSKLTLSLLPADIDSIAEETDFFVSNGGLGGTSSFLLRGVPQLLVPTQTEQLLSSAAAERSGLGLIAKKGANGKMVTPITDLDSLKDGCMAFARSKRSSEDNMKLLINNLTN